MGTLRGMNLLSKQLRGIILALGEWYSCRGLALVANSGISILGVNHLFLEAKLVVGTLTVIHLSKESLTEREMHLNKHIGEKIGW